MDIISSGGHLEVPRAGTGESVYGACVGELRRDGGSRHMVWIEWTGGLAFSILGFDIRRGSDARYAGHPWECHGVGNDHYG